jgi:hypothetical protein
MSYFVECVVVNDKMKVIWDETVITFKALSQHSPGSRTTEITLQLFKGKLREAYDEYKHACTREPAGE